MEELQNSRTVLKVRVNNREEGYHYIWNEDKFINWLFLIREVMD